MHTRRKDAIHGVAWLTEVTVVDTIEKLVLVLRDGRKLIGVLRSWDQFGINCFESADSELH